MSTGASGGTPPKQETVFCWRQDENPPVSDSSGSDVVLDAAAECKCLRQSPEPTCDQLAAMTIILMGLLDPL